MPGKNPKPPPEEYTAQTWRCLLEGVRRADPAVHAQLLTSHGVFRLISWNYSYYGSYRDISIDMPSIEAVLKQQEATPEEMRQARGWRSRIARLLCLLADFVPALIDHIVDARIKAAIVETRRYFENRDGIAEIVRRPLAECIRESCRQDVPILIIGHSLGSIIAYDTLWLLSHVDPAPGVIDQFLTIGSPLGTQYAQKRLLGHGTAGRTRYPTNIRRWCNISAVGDLTAFDPRVRNDFRKMLKLGIIEDIRDYEEPVYNFFRIHGALNVHRSYGYLVNRAVGGVIAEWWRRQAILSPGGAAH